MTDHDGKAAECDPADGAIELTIKPKLKDLGEFTVRRILPAVERRMVGPFVFFDHMGPAEFPPGEGIAVRPHPHIGLATITYLFDGQIMHRDSLGYQQPIKPGAVNLMTAGRGIVHSERAGDDLDEVSTLHGIQSWMALPVEDEETDPEFIHYAADSLPELEQDGVRIRVIMGSAYGAASPVKQFSPTLYLECLFAADSKLALPDDYDEIAFYVVSGSVTVSGQTYDAGTMAVAGGEGAVCIEAGADADCRVMVIGGTTLGKRTIWWNFVSSSKERIEQAKSDWREMKFGSVEGDDEFIPLPD